MERRKFLGAVPLAIGGSMVLQPTQSIAQTTPISPIWTNVKSFGATGNGTTDDTAAILSAISSLELNSDYRGGVLYFPAGRYICSASLVFTAYDQLHNIIVRGDGPVCTTLDFTNASSGSSGLIFNAGAQFGVEGLMINGAPGDGLLIGNGNSVNGNESCWLFTIRNVRIQNCGSNGFMFVNTYMGTVEDCWSNLNTNIGFLFAGFHTSTNVSRCYASQNTGYGWSLNAMTYSSFTACGADKNQRGYGMTNMIGVAFVSCGAESNLCEGWLLSAADSTVTGLPAWLQDIHGVTFTSCSSYYNSQSGANAFASHIGVSTDINNMSSRPIQFKVSGNTSECAPGSTISMALTGNGGPITVYDELSYFSGTWLTTGAVTRKTL